MSKITHLTQSTADDLYGDIARLSREMDYGWITPIFHTSGRTGNRGTVTPTIRTIAMISGTNVFEDVIYIGHRGIWQPSGSGQPARWDQPWTIYMEMDTNNQSTADKHLTVGKAGTTVYSTFMPATTDRYIHVQWHGNTGLQSHLCYNGKITSSPISTLSQNLGFLERYAVVWDGVDTLSVYGALWLHTTVSVPQMSLIHALTLEEEPTNIAMMDGGVVMVAQTHVNSGGNSLSSTVLHDYRFCRRAVPANIAG
jgi:hypothetical protein